MSVGEWFENFGEHLWLRPDESGADEAAFLRRALHLRRGQSVLDCPCGTGRIAFHLAQAGCHVTGVDRNASFVARAARRFADARLRGQFHVLDMRLIDFDGEFDAACNYWGSFGYFNDAENEDFLRRLARSVRRGGRVLLEQLNRQYVLRRFRPRIEMPHAVAYPVWNRRRQRIEARWTQRIGRRTVESFSSIRVYTLGQISRMMRRTGLQLESACGGIDGSDYGPLSHRMVVVGRRR